MTKVTIIGEEPTENKLKPIKFVSSFNGRIWRNACVPPEDWDNIELITRNYTKEFDLMFAYDDNDRSGGVICLGHFNDGVV